MQNGKRFIKRSAWISTINLIKFMEKLLSTSIISVQFSFKHIYVDSERKGEDYSVVYLIFLGITSRFVLYKRRL